MPAWRFGPFTLDPDAGVLARDGTDTGAQPLVVKLLTHAAERPGVLLTRDALLALLWPDVFVTDHSLSQLSHRVRTLLGPHRDWWATVPRRGYRFDAPVEVLARPTVAAEVPSGTSFHGRAAELAWLRDHARPGTWTMVLGPGGAGKTRLVRELVRTLGAVWVDLSELREPGPLIERLATELGLTLAPSGQAAQVGRALAARGPGLVVLDNLEQLAEPCYAVLGGWWGQAPQLTWLGTSRVRGTLDGAQVLELPPLDDPTARELFRARAAFAGVAVEEAHEDALRGIVSVLAGLPLALELAAARVVVLDPPALRARLDSQLGTLGGGARGPERHHSMRAAVRWSWDLLGDFEQQTLLRLALFRGGASVDLVERATGDRAAEVLDAVHRLQRHFLVQVAPSLPDGGRRLTLHPLVRAFALEELDRRADRASLESAFAEVMSERMRAARSLLREWDDTTRAVLEADLPSADEAVRRTGGAGGLREHTVIAMQLCGRFSAARALVGPPAPAPLGLLAHAVLGQDAHVREVLDALEPCLAGLDHDGDPATASEILRLLAQSGVQRGHFDTGRALAERALGHARDADDPVLRAWACLPLAGARMRTGALVEARRACEEGLGSLPPDGHPALRSALLDVRGRTELLDDDVEAAARTLGDALALTRGRELDVRTGSIELNLAGVNEALGRLDTAAALLERAVDRFRRLGWSHGQAVARNNLGLNAMYRGELALAGRELATAAALDDSPYVQRLLATTRALLRLLQGAPAEVLAAVDAGLEAGGGDPETEATLLTLRMLAAGRLGDAALADRTASTLEGRPTEAWSRTLRRTVALAVAHTRGAPVPDGPYDPLVATISGYLSRSRGSGGTPPRS